MLPSLRTPTCRSPWQLAAASMLLAFLIPGSASAYTSYPGLVPNPSWATRTDGSSERCITCHNNPDGGLGCGAGTAYPAADRCLNPFGLAFRVNGSVWNGPLANLDSDGDGFTNGQELQDPMGAWQPGLAYPGIPSHATRPGFAGSSPGLQDDDGDGWCWIGQDSNGDHDCVDANENGLSISQGDCNDANAMINPSASEMCSTPDDDDCNGLPTLQDPVCSSVVDADGDGYCPMGIDTNADRDCVDANEATSDVDCDDASVIVGPGAAEVCTNGDDDDCDSLVDKNDPDCTGEGDRDADRYCPIGQDLNLDGDCLDGSQETDGPSDCDDRSASVNPGASEACGNLRDDDCDGTVDFADVDCAPVADQDGDGYCPDGRDLSMPKDGDCVDANEQGAGVDCDDSDPLRFPTQTEICTDAIDQDCDGQGALGDSDCAAYADTDSDRYCGVGIDYNGDQDCADPGELSSYVDCLDTDATVYTGAEELCTDAKDNDCDGATDATDGTCVAYADTDRDGYCVIGIDGNGDGDCSDADEQPAGVPADAAPDDSTVSPGAQENCIDLRDNDQDGAVDGDDPDCTGPGATTDTDGDGYCRLGRDLDMDGDCADAAEAAYAVSDCREGDAAFSPGAREDYVAEATAQPCFDYRDNDCDGNVDLYDTGCAFVFDDDRDGYCGHGVDDNNDGDCLDLDEQRYGDDCADDDPTANPSMLEVCTNGKDDDCDGRADGRDLDCGGCETAAQCAAPGMCQLAVCTEGVCGSVPDPACGGAGGGCSAGGARPASSPHAWLLGLALVAMILRRFRRSPRALWLGAVLFASASSPGGPTVARAWEGYESLVPNGEALYAALGGASAMSNISRGVCNGTTKPRISGNFGNGCLLCHQSIYGGYDSFNYCQACSTTAAGLGYNNTDGGTNPSCNNAFGRAIKWGPDGSFFTSGDNSSSFWDQWLARLDSDGDGWTNGQELGDPFANWSYGGSNAYGLGYRGQPGVLASEPADINLCSTAGYRDCSANSTCSDAYNGSGGWTCTCNTGYYGNGHATVSPWVGGSAPYSFSGATGCTIYDCGSPPTTANGTRTWSSTTYGSVASYSCNTGYQRGAWSTSTCGTGTWSATPTCTLVNCGTPPTVTNGTRTWSTTTYGSTASYSCNTGYQRSGSATLTCTQPVANGGGSWGTAPTCTNINECTSGPNPCLSGGAPSGTCTDTIGSYSCACPIGWAFNGTTCVVNDACVSGQNDCNVNATCQATGGSTFTCTCNSGYTGTGRGANGCSDVNECASPATHTCTAPNAICNNTVGSYFCSCATGYVWDPVSKTCPNENECARPMRPCTASQACVDSVGSYSCVSCGANAHPTGNAGAETCVCNTGYEGNAYAGCTDIDECAPAVRTCAQTSACFNTPGSYTCTPCGLNASPQGSQGAELCTCNTGYAGNPLSLCSDIDECSQDPGPCSPNATCLNTTGAYVCTCNSGYQGTGEVCLDVDDCVSINGGCLVHEVCVNQIGLPHTCECEPGYTRPASDPSAACESTCGNSQRVFGEECDDGNVVAGDGCSPTCEIEPGHACYEPTRGGLSVCRATCGDARIDPPGEECDNGTEANSDSAPDACRTSCKRAHCGDRVVDSAEGCDEGTSNSDVVPDACRSTCVPAYCGDGVVDPGRGEQCDHGYGQPLPDDYCATSRGCRRKVMAPAVDGGVDGGSSGSSGSDGCGCRVGAPSRSRTSAWVLSLFVLSLVTWRRRRR